MAKAFLIDVAKCSGCHGCQVSCKDEHCGQAWPPYAEAQPLTGQFWCRVDERERGKTPMVTVSYVPVICGHCEHCALERIGGDAVYRREDGLVIIDPEKARGRRDLVDACPLGAVYWNEELQLPQKCTGCAHLLDDGWEVPRCVDSCAHKAIQFADEEELDLEGAEPLSQIRGLGPRVYYKNLPKRFVGGSVYDPELEDIVEGARVVLRDANGETVAETVTDYMGDWKFDQVEPARYEVAVSVGGYESLEFEADVTDDDLYAGDRALVPCSPVEGRLRVPAPLDPPRSLHSRERAPETADDGAEDEVEVVLNAATKISDLAVVPEAAAAIEEVFPGFLANDEVMGKVAGTSFATLTAAAPNLVPGELVAQLDGKLHAVQEKLREEPQPVG